MRLEMIEFRGEAVGVRLVAETAGDQHLLYALRRAEVRVNETYGSGQALRLELCPSLPWDNDYHPANWLNPL